VSETARTLWRRDKSLTPAGIPVSYHALLVILSSHRRRRRRHHHHHHHNHYNHHYADTTGSVGQRESQLE